MTVPCCAGVAQKTKASLDVTYCDDGNITASPASPSFTLGFTDATAMKCPMALRVTKKEMKTLGGEGFSPAKGLQPGPSRPFT
jgi:hypothetical protein